MFVDSSSDEDVDKPNIGPSTKVNQGSQDEENAPSTPPMVSLPPRKNKKQKVEAQDTLPTATQKPGTLDLITTLREDTSFDENIWSQANLGNWKL